MTRSKLKIDKKYSKLAKKEHDCNMYWYNLGKRDAEKKGLLLDKREKYILTNYVDYLLNYNRKRIASEPITSGAQLIDLEENDKMLLKLYKKLKTA